MKKLSCLMIVLLLPAKISLCLAAGCELSDSTVSENIDTGDILVQRDAPVGGVLYKKILPGTGVTLGSCNEGGYAKSVRIDSLQRLSGTTNLFRSGIEGVGIKLQSDEGVLTDTSEYTEMGPATLKDEDNIIFSLIKTGPVSPGPLLPQELLRINYSSEEGGTVVAKQVVLSGGTVSQASCQVQTPSVVVPMGNLDRKLLRGVNSTAGTRDFQIGLDCNKNTSVNITFSPLTGKGTSTQGLRGVAEPEAREGGASGVGIQLLYGGNPVDFGVLTPVGKTESDGFYTIPLQARYFQFADRVTPGALNAMVAFTMTYQ